MKSDSLVRIVVISVLLLTGCMGPWRAKQYEVPQDTKEHRSTIVVMNKTLTEAMKVVQQKAERTDDGRMRIYLEIRSRSKDKLVIQVQTVFRDEEGVALEETPWENVVLDRFAIKHYRIESLTNKASSYVMRIKSSTEIDD